MAKRASKPPLAALKDAILAADWAGVAAAYAGLTGETLAAGPAVPAKPKKARAGKAAPPAPEPPAGGAVLLPVPAPAAPKVPPTGKRYAVPAAAAGGFVNTWVPPAKASARELAVDRKLLKGVEPEERGLRGQFDAAQNEKVPATCDKCGRGYRAFAWEVDRVAEGERLANRCDRCLGS